MQAQAYRREVLRRELSEGLKPMPAQVSRTRLHAFKSHLRQGRFRMGFCSSCACAERQQDLIHVEFPPCQRSTKPAWLQSWSDEDWATFGEACGRP